MRQIEKRLTDLERQQPAGFEVVYGYDQTTYEELPEAEFNRLVSEARRRVGANGTVLQVVYDHNWRGADESQPE